MVKVPQETDGTCKGAHVAWYNEDNIPKIWKEFNSNKTEKMVYTYGLATSTDISIPGAMGAMGATAIIAMEEAPDGDKRPSGGKPRHCLTLRLTEKGSKKQMSQFVFLAAL